MTDLRAARDSRIIDRGIQRARTAPAPPERSIPITEHEPIGDWALDALCRDLDVGLFFPAVPGDIYTTVDAKAICRQCPVRVDCLDYAVRNHERFGVWGGTSPKDRQKMWRGRR